MGGGYVLRFSNRTFEEFFREIVGVEIYDRTYDRGSGSKANRMRAFWDLASDDQMVRLLQGLVEAWDLYSDGSIPMSAKELIGQILHRLEGPQTDGITVPADGQGPKLDPDTLQTLQNELLGLSNLTAQQRGYAFEAFLKNLFEANELAPRASFRLVGEQIDGSFELQNETYLLEAKWQNAPVGAADLHTFEGKLGQKARWSRGPFVSYSGFSNDGLQAFGRGKSLICMDGRDISEMLIRQHSIADVLSAKVRRAAETGEPHTALRDLYL